MALDAARRTLEGTQRAVAAWGRARVKVNAMQATVSHLGGGWRGDSVREAVESALDAEDITPLVRLYMVVACCTRCISVTIHHRLFRKWAAAAAQRSAKNLRHSWTC